MKWSDPDILKRMMQTKFIWHEQIIQIAIKKAKNLRYVADIACGATGLLPRLFNRKWETVAQPIIGIGIDSDAKVIFRAQQQAKEPYLPIFYFQSDITDLSVIPACMFDVLFCWETFYLLTDSQLSESLKGMKTILISDGIIICGALGPRERPDPVIDPYCQTAGKKILPHLAVWRSIDEYMNIFRQHGLNVEYKRIYVSEQEYKNYIAPIAPEEMFF